MSRIFPIIVIFFSLWMVYDAYRRKAPYYWYLIIFFVPFGAFIYFLVVKNVSRENGATGHLPKQGDSLAEARARFDALSSVENRLVVARILQSRSKFSEAIAEFEQVLKTHPEDKDALFGIGTCSFSLKDYPTVISKLESLVDVQPSYNGYAAWPVLAEALWHSDKKDRSISLMEQLCRLTHQIDHQLMLARCYLEVENRADARRILEEAETDFNRALPHIQKASAGEMRQVRRMLTSLR